MLADSSEPMPASGSSSSSTWASVASTMAISSWRCSPWLSTPDDPIDALAQARLFDAGAGFFQRPLLVHGLAEDAPGLLAARLRGQAHVLQHRELREDVGALVAAPNAHLRALGWRSGVRCPGPWNDDAPSLGGRSPEQHVDAGGFARAVGPSRRVDHAALQGDIQSPGWPPDRQSGGSVWSLQQHFLACIRAHLASPLAGHAGCDPAHRHRPPGRNSTTPTITPPSSSCQYLVRSETLRAWPPRQRPRPWPHRGCPCRPESPSAARCPTRARTAAPA